MIGNLLNKIHQADCLNFMRYKSNKYAGKKGELKMDELKFRVWDIKNRCFLKQTSCMKFCLANSTRSYNLTYFFKKGKYIIDQWIGLNDSNDIPIFRGDLVTDRKHVYMVLWHETGYEFLDLDTDVFVYLGPHHIGYGHYEVIGHTHI